jgi:hypothetical protein
MKISESSEMVHPFLYTYGGVKAIRSCVIVYSAAMALECPTTSSLTATWQRKPKFS